jgi:hypothetical protein
MGEVRSAYKSLDTIQNLIQEEIKRRVNSGNACYHSVQNLLSSLLLSKKLKIRIYKTIILPVVLYGCETWWRALVNLILNLRKLSNGYTTVASGVVLSSTGLVS